MDKQQIKTENAPGAIGPYAQAIKTGSFVFTSGQIPLDPTTGEMVQDCIEVQTARVLDNLKAVLEAAGCSLKDVVKTTVYLKDMNSFAAFNAVYAQYFCEPYPGRSCVEVARLPKDALVEIEAVAVCP